MKPPWQLNSCSCFKTWATGLTTGFTNCNNIGFGGGSVSSEGFEIQDETAAIGIDELRKVMTDSVISANCFRAITIWVMRTRSGIAFNFP